MFQAMTGENDQFRRHVLLFFSMKPEIGTSPDLTERHNCSGIEQRSFLELFR
jgi:hypothetical protein